MISNFFLHLLSCSTIFVAITGASPFSIKGRDEENTHSNESIIHPLAVINHDAVEGFPNDFGSGTLADLYAKYKPTLRVINGCVPFPAVDRNGNTGGGLNPSGAMNGKCSSSPGQIYIRSKRRQNNRLAVMYAWYFPKDQNVDGPANGGHRHDWEHIVVWLSSQDSSARVIGISYSGHGGYTKHSRAAGNIAFDGNRPKVGYSNYGGMNHSLRSERNGSGGGQNMVNWSRLTSAARNALQNTNFGRATCPIKDGYFEDRIDESWDSTYNN